MRKTFLICAVLLAIVATGCRSGAGVVMWGPCTPGTDPTGTDGRYAMVCENGEWIPVMTADEFVRISRGEPNVVIAPLPKRPVVTTTTSTTTTSTTASTTTTTTTPPVLTVVGLTPPRGTIDGGTIATITGSNFTGATAVTFGGTPVAFTVISDTSITAMTPAHAAGAVDVVVTGSSGSATLADGYEYVGPPTITLYSSTFIDAETTGTLTIYGTNLLDVTVVQIGNSFATVLGTPTNEQITVEYPPLPMGDYDVTVVTPHGDITEFDALTARP